MDVPTSDAPTGPAAQPRSSCPQTGSADTSPIANRTSPSPKPTTAPSPSPPPSSPTPEQPYRSIPTDAIDLPDPNNHRTTPDDARITTLAASIHEIGLLHPITLRPNGTRFTLVAGLGRLLACKQLHWHTIPARILQADDHKTALATLSENVTRSNLSPVEEALQLATLVETHPQGTIGVSDQLGRSQTWVEDRLDILTWPTKLIEQVHARRISLAAAKHLARIEDPTTQAMYVHDAAENGISARTASLWRQSAASAPYDSADASEKSVTAPLSPLETTTTCVCFCCRNSVGIEDTRQARICSRCCLELGAAPSTATQLHMQQGAPRPPHHETSAHYLPTDQTAQARPETLLPHD